MDTTTLTPEQHLAERDLHAAQARDHEREAVLGALEAEQWRLRAAARRLGVRLGAFRRYIERYPDIARRYARAQSSAHQRTGANGGATADNRAQGRTNSAPAATADRPNVRKPVRTRS